jgi:hypothetical protein
MSLTSVKRERATSPAVVEIPGTPIGTAELERNCSMSDIVESVNVSVIKHAKWPDKAPIIEVDAFESLKHPKRSAEECEGYTITFAEGNSPHTTYPFALQCSTIQSAFHGSTR